MKIRLIGKEITDTLFSVPEFNFGQMQRWTGKERLKYSLELETSSFIEKYSNTFSEFRENEILENDPFDIQELIDYQKADRPTLNQLLESNLPLLKSLIIYHQYEILHLLIKNSQENKLFYSINSIDNVKFKNNTILFQGICF